MSSFGDRAGAPPSVGSGDATRTPPVVEDEALTCPNQRGDACLRIMMHKKATREALSAYPEASKLFPGKPVEALLYRGLRVSHERSTSRAGAGAGAAKNVELAFRTCVFRDFAGFYRQLLPPRGGGGAAPTGTVLRPHSLLVAARAVLDRFSHVDDDPVASSSAVTTRSKSEKGQLQQQQLTVNAGFGAFVERSLGLLVNEVTEAITSIKDWDRLWDVVRTKFVKRMPIVFHHETSGTSTNDAITVDDDGDDEGDSNAFLGTETTSFRLVEKLAWRLFCAGWRCLPQVARRNERGGSPTTSAVPKTATTAPEGDSSTNKMRRLRMTVAGGALVLLAALYEESFPESGQVGDDPDGPADPPGKRVRVATLAQTLVDAVKDQGARRTRYGTMHSTADALVDGGITASEVEEQAEALAALVWRVTAASTMRVTKAQPEKRAPAASSNVKWLRKQELTRFGDESSGHFFLSAGEVIPNLAKTVDILYSETNLKPSANEDGFIYDVGTLVDLDSLEAVDDPRHNRLYSRLADEFSGANRTVAAPPVFTDAMELNEWSVALMGIQAVKPCQNLFEMIEAIGPGSVMKHVVPALNRALHRIGEEFVTESQASRQMWVYVVDTGRVVINGDETSDKKFARAVVALYYHALEALLFCERERLRASPIGMAEGESKLPPRDRVNETLYRRLISSQPFHSALLTCSLLCVHKAVGGTQLMMNHLHSFTALHVCECHPEDFLKVSDSFRRYLSGNTPARGNLGSSLALDIPRLLWKEVRTAERNTLDVFLWRGEVQSFMGKVEGLRERRLWPPDSLGPDEDDDPDVEDAKSKNLSSRTEGYSELRSVAYIFRRVLNVASARIVSLLEFLDVRSRPVVARQVYVAFRHVLRRHVDLLHDRHLDHMILCCLYGVGKQLQCEPSITFSTLNDAYVAVRGQEEGDVTCQRIVRHIKLDTAMDDTDNEPVGNIIQLYNLVFLPLMKEYLLKSTSLQRAAAQMKDPTAEQRSREAVAGAIQVSIRGRGPRGGGGGAAGAFRGASGFPRGRLDHDGAIVAVEIGSASSYKAAELANDLTRQRMPN